VEAKQNLGVYCKKTKKNNLRVVRVKKKWNLQKENKRTCVMM
jgi:hypothetical protein